MSGVFPISVKTPTSPALLRSHTPTRVSTSHSMKRQVRSRAVQRFSFKLSWINLTRAQYQVLNSFLLAQRGQFETFTIVPPIHSSPLGIWPGMPVVNGANQNGRALSVSGFSVSQTVAKAGDIFKLSGHAKVYMLTADATSDVTGIATLVFEPALMVTPGNGEAVAHTDVPFQVCLVSDNLESPVRVGALYDIEIDVVEDI